MNRTVKILALIGLTLIPSVAMAQRGRGGGRDDNRPMSPQEITERLARLDSMLKDMDANHNGTIEADEAESGRGRFVMERIFSRMGTQPRYPIAISELRQGSENYYRSHASGDSSGGSAAPASGSPPKPAFSFTEPPKTGGGFSFGPPQPAAPPATGGSGTPAGASKPAAPAAPAPPPAASKETPSKPESTTPAPGSSADVKTAPPRKSGRFLSPKQRLPKDLPAWFLEKDTDGDGQVSMAEFANRWTPEAAAEFDRSDLNRDGIITASECLKAEKQSAGSK